MDWEECVICGDSSGALKCPADSKQNNGAEIYRNFLESFQGFKALQSLLKFASADTAETFLSHRAKWHKSCYLKFAPSKLGLDHFFFIMKFSSFFCFIVFLYMSAGCVSTIRT